MVGWHACDIARHAYILWYACRANQSI